MVSDGDASTTLAAPEGSDDAGTARQPPAGSGPAGTVLLAMSQRGGTGDRGAAIAKDAEEATANRGAAARVRQRGGEGRPPRDIISGAGQPSRAKLAMSCGAA